MEYANKFYKLSEYIQWVNVDKTIIMLDGGTYPELKECRDRLIELGVPVASFYEEDLGNILTSISFLGYFLIFKPKAIFSYTLI